MLGPQEKILRKISSTTSMHEFNVMKRNIEHMYESSHYNTSHESLLSNLERFIKSVNTMAHTVMIPSRLMDLQVDEIDISDKMLSSYLPRVKAGQTSAAIDEDVSSISSCDSSSFDQMSNISYTNNNGNADHKQQHQHQPPPPPATRSMSNLINSTSKNSSPTVVSSSNKLDMYTAYKMLVSARNDLVWATTLEEESPEFSVNVKDEDADEYDSHEHTQHILMVKFKHHLDALNEITASFADLAECLTSKYECHENMN